MKRIRGELDAEFTCFDGTFVFFADEFGKGRSPRSLHERTVALDRLRLTVFDWEDAEPKRVGTDRRNLDFDFAASDLKILSCGLDFGDTQKACGANGASAFQNVATVVTVGHLICIPRNKEDLEVS